MHGWTGMVLKRFENRVARHMVLQALIPMLWLHLGLGVLSGSWQTLVLGPGCPLVGLNGPGIGKSLPEDLVLVLEVEVDGLVSIAGWSCKDLIPMGILLCLCEGIFLMVIGMLGTWRVVLGTACSVGMSVPVPAVSDSLCRSDESATTSSTGSHLNHWSHLLKCCHWCHLYCTHYCLGKVWTCCCRW